MAKIQRSDVLVLGSGIAGLATALKAAEHGLSVTVLAKRKAEETNSSHAQGGIASVLREDDSFLSHIDDTVKAGAGLQVLMRHMETAPLRRAATLLLGLTFFQVFLGFAAWSSRAATIDDPQPMPVMIWATVAHVTAGSLVFGAAIALSMIVYWHDEPARPNLARGGMAVA